MLQYNIIANIYLKGLALSYKYKMGITFKLKIYIKLISYILSFN